jgi:hypothetical protein
MTRITLLASVATLVAAPVFAQDQSDAQMENGEQMAQENGQTEQSQMDGEQYASGTMSADRLENMIRTSEIVGGDVYAVDRNEWTDADWADVEVIDEVGANWEDIGNITDVVLSPDGMQVGLIVSHGGFLDIGDDTVLLTMDDVRRLGRTEDMGGDYNYVTRLTEEEIENMQEVEENWF